MRDIGNASDAQFIYDWVRAHSTPTGRPTESAEECPPKGWKFLGKGCYRSTWRSPEGIAYKVQHRPRTFQSNKKEYEKIIEAHEIGPISGTRLPSCSYFKMRKAPFGDGVLAMECVQGKTLYARFEYDVPEEFMYIMNEVENTYRISDMHTENIMIEDGTDILIPVDFG